MKAAKLYYAGIEIRPADKVWWARATSEGVEWVIDSHLSSNEARLRRQESGWVICGCDPAPLNELPTIPGYYVGDYEPSPSGKVLIELLGTNQWVDSTDSKYLKNDWVQRLGNLTRLVPACESVGPANE